MVIVGLGSRVTDGGSRGGIEWALLVYTINSFSINIKILKKKNIKGNIVFLGMRGMKHATKSKPRDRPSAKQN